MDDAATFADPSSLTPSNHQKEPCTMRYPVLTRIAMLALASCALTAYAQDKKNVSPAEANY